VESEVGVVEGSSEGVAVCSELGSREGVAVVWVDGFDVGLEEKGVLVGGELGREEGMCDREGLGGMEGTFVGLDSEVVEVATAVGTIEGIIVCEGMGSKEGISVGEGGNVGKVVGRRDGIRLGPKDGDIELEDEGLAVGEELGKVEGAIGWREGTIVGFDEGVIGVELGVVDGEADGAEVGLSDGNVVGVLVGIGLGCPLGVCEGTLVGGIGKKEGSLVGATLEGATVGNEEGTWLGVVGTLDGWVPLIVGVRVGALGSNGIKVGAIVGVPGMSDGARLTTEGAGLTLGATEGIDVIAEISQTPGFWLARDL
jgi:hypothetical protein